MKEQDLEKPDNEVKRIANHILKKKPEEIEVYGGTEGPYIKIYGDELQEKFPDSFIQDNLEVSVFFDRKPFTQHYNVSAYWGNKVRVDVIALDDDGKKIPEKEIKDYLIKGLMEYKRMTDNQRYSYSFLKR